MAEKNNATCSICGNEYYVCLACRDSIKLAPWKVHTDTSEHYKVYQIIRGFSTGVYTKEEAKAKFKNVDLSDLNSFRPHIKKIVKDIIKEEKPVVKNVEKIEPVDTEIAKVAEEIVVEDVEKIDKSENISKTAYSRKKNYRVDVE